MTVEDGSVECSTDVGDGVAAGVGMMEGTGEATAATDGSLERAAVVLTPLPVGAESEEDHAMAKAL